MLVGFMEPSAGTAIINGFDILHDMDVIYTQMGVCPQVLLLHSPAGLARCIYHALLPLLDASWATGLCTALPCPAAALLRFTAQLSPPSTLLH